MLRSRSRKAGGVAAAADLPTRGRTSPLISCLYPQGARAVDSLIRQARLLATVLLQVDDEICSQLAQLKHLHVRGTKQVSSLIEPCGLGLDLLAERHGFFARARISHGLPQALATPYGALHRLSGPHEGCG